MSTRPLVVPIFARIAFSSRSIVARCASKRRRVGIVLSPFPAACGVLQSRRRGRRESCSRSSPGPSPSPAPAQVPLLLLPALLFVLADEIARQVAPRLVGRQGAVAIGTDDCHL